MTVKTPWFQHYGDVPANLDYPPITMYELVAAAAERYGSYAACRFMGNTISYRQLLTEIRRTAAAFTALGITKGDRVTICLPNIPQAVFCFYALNMIGAVANMIHPLSAETEIIFYLEDSRSKALVILDQFYPKFAAIGNRCSLPKLIVADIADALSLHKHLLYKMTAGRKIEPIPPNDNIVRWSDFIAATVATTDVQPQGTADDLAAILYSGGTSGTTKGILLSNSNFNALALQTAAMSNCMASGNNMMAMMPIFHGFGLGVCIHTGLTHGCCCLLVPRFNTKSYAKLLRKEKPHYIAGVPTLFEAILRNPDLKNANLSYLRGVFSGGDTLTVDLKKRFDNFLKQHGATVEIREGYGTTECVTASCLTPYNIAREGSIGLPFPDTYYKIVAVDSDQEQPYGEEGEICISGPSVMIGYANNDEETAKVLRYHQDGLLWLHTGDIGVMDEEGFVYFRQRIKRIIVSRGYSIYPSQLENILDAHPKVASSCVIGVADSYQGQKVKAFVVLNETAANEQAVRDELLQYCHVHIAKYAIPAEIEFRDSLPQTLVGKIAYTKLQ